MRTCTHTSCSIFSASCCCKRCDSLIALLIRIVGSLDRSPDRATTVLAIQLVVGCFDGLKLTWTDESLDCSLTCALDRYGGRSSTVDVARPLARTDDSEYERCVGISIPDLSTARHGYYVPRVKGSRRRVETQTARARTEVRAGASAAVGTSSFSGIRSI